MGVWVRSQDKRILYYTKYFTINKKNNKKEMANTTWEIRSISDLLGVYESEERCLEILDEIQQDICLARVYQMPEE